MRPIDGDKFRRSAQITQEEDPEAAYVTATLQREPADRPWTTITEIRARDRAIKKDKLKAYQA